MNSRENKKIAAAVTAIHLFLEKETLEQELETVVVKESDKKSELKSAKREEMLKEIRSSSTSWSYAGRMESMSIRNLWQLKLYK